MVSLLYCLIEYAMLEYYQILFFSITSNFFLLYLYRDMFSTRIFYLCSL